MTDRQKQFEKALNEFPEPMREILQTIPGQAGRLSAPQCIEMMEHLGIDPEELMTRLLPLAKIYALVPVSGFQVGAVAMADSRSNEDRFDLFMGAMPGIKVPAICRPSPFPKRPAGTAGNFSMNLRKIPI